MTTFGAGFTFHLNNYFKKIKDDEMPEANLLNKIALLWNV